MTQDRMTTLFLEMFSGLPRQGPGDAASTLRALALVPDVGPETRILDIGCGTGLQTRVLAQHSPAQIVGIDNYAPYVEELNRQAQLLGIANRVEGRVGDMCRLDFADGSFDLIWCEGAIFVIGFEAGLRQWRRLLVPGGFMAVSEVCWTRPDPPPDCAAFWREEYPAIRSASVLLDLIPKCGYETVGHFMLPPSAWWGEYYAPLQQNLARFRERHAREPDAQDLADRVQREIDIWHRYSEFYSYQFFVMCAH